MSETTSEDSFDTPSPRLGGRNDAILLALGETRAAARQAADTAIRVEGAVGGLATRVGSLEVDFASFKAAAAARDVARDQADKARRDEIGPRTSVATWISLAMSGLLALYVVIQNTPHVP